jgi:hypothetical protein
MALLSLTRITDHQVEDLKMSRAKGMRRERRPTRDRYSSDRRWLLRVVPEVAQKWGATAEEVARSMPGDDELMEIADFPMMRKCLLNIRARAESSASTPLVKFKRRGPVPFNGLGAAQ